MKNKKQKPNGDWVPSLTLILAAWYETTLLEKAIRFKEHIEWEDKNYQLEEISDYLKSLKEDDWYQFGEL